MTNQEINEAVENKLGHFVVSESQNKRMIPNYCGNIMAAWEIFDKCHRVKMEYLLGEWQCEMDGAFADATTAPRAICLAFLELKTPHPEAGAGE